MSDHTVPNAIVLIGPDEWMGEHERFLARKGETSMQYSAKTWDSTLSRLRELQLPFKVYIYVPKLYRCFNRGITLPGIGRVTSVANVVAFEHDPNRTVSPWPTIDSRPYDKNDEDPLEYEYWFRVNRLDTCDIDIEDFEVVLTNGEARRYSQSEFARFWRGKIAFVKLDRSSDPSSSTAHGEL